MKSRPTSGRHHRLLAARLDASPVARLNARQAEQDAALAQMAPTMAELLPILTINNSTLRQPGGHLIRAIIPPDARGNKRHERGRGHVLARWAGSGQSGAFYRSPLPTMIPSLLTTRFRSAGKRIIIPAQVEVGETPAVER